MVAPKLVRIQENGQVTLPADVCKRLGLKIGDLVSVEETPEGVLIRSQQVFAVEALDRIGEALREKGLSLDELIESGRQERAEIIKETYGIETDDPDR